MRGFLIVSKKIKEFKNNNNKNEHSPRTLTTIKNTTKYDVGNPGTGM
jgi:hypothetical protein